MVQPNIFKTISPRAHVAFDLTGDGKSVLKGGYGHSVHMRLNGGYELTHLNPNGAKTYTYNWRDLNGNRNYDKGEVNLNPNGPDFISNGGLTQGIVNANEVPPTSDEYSIGFERQLAKDLGLRVSGVYARNNHVPPFLNPSLPYIGVHDSDREPVAGQRRRNQHGAIRAARSPTTTTRRRCAGW